MKQVQRVPAMMFQFLYLLTLRTGSRAPSCTPNTHRVAAGITDIIMFLQCIWLTGDRFGMHQRCETRQKRAGMCVGRLQPVTYLNVAHRESHWSIFNTTEFNWTCFDGFKPSAYVLLECGTPRKFCGVRHSSRYCPAQLFVMKYWRKFGWKAEWREQHNRNRRLGFRAVRQKRNNDVAVVRARRGVCDVGFSSLSEAGVCTRRPTHGRSW